MNVQMGRCVLISDPSHRSTVDVETVLNEKINVGMYVQRIKVLEIWTWTRPW